MRNHIWTKGLVLGIVTLFVLVNIPSGQSLNQTISSKQGNKEGSQDGLQQIFVDKTLTNQVSVSAHKIDRGDRSNQSWWNSSWSYRKKITINHTEVAGDLVNFPVLVKTIMNKSKVQTDGNDIIFTDNQGIKLNHEIELYDSTTGELIAWVNITSLSSTEDTTLWMYYGNPTCDNQQNNIGTWDSNYLLVDHMNDITPSTTKDSTINRYNGTKRNANEPVEFASGKIYRSQDFDGLNDRIDHTSPVIGTGVKTISMWYYTDVDTEAGVFTNSNGGGTSQDNGVVIWEFPGNKIGFGLGSGSPGGFMTVNSSDIVSPGYWHYLTFYYDGTTLGIYVNTTLAGSTTTKVNPEVAGSNNLRFGGRNYADDYHFDGKLDEIRVSNVARSVDWITTENNNQILPSTFINIGEEHPFQTPDTVYVDDNFNSSTPGWRYDHFNHIQDGVNAVAENGTVFVLNGIYYENVLIIKNHLTLQGEEKNTTIIDVSRSGNGLLIQNTDHITISGLTIQNASESGILINGFSSEHSWINHDFNLSNLIICNNSANGIYIHATGYGCRISNTQINNCEIFSNGGSGIFVHADGNHCIIGESPSYTNISNCMIRDNTIGISLRAESHHSYIASTTISNCTIEDNNDYGIETSISGDCWNEGNIIYHNNFINNTANACDPYANIWQNNQLHQGNYWNDYFGSDNNFDGIGDTPYNISGGSNQDLYPLMQPWNGSLLPPPIPVIVYVDDDYTSSTPGWGYDHFSSIQVGIDAVDVGGNIFVNNGVYNEPFLIPEYTYLYIDKSINLIGENKDTTIVNCPNAGNSGGQFGILVGWQSYSVVGNVNISGFTFHGGHNSESIGIYVQPDDSDIRVENCIVDSFADGISLVDVTDCLIQNCTFYDNSRDGGIDLAGGGNHVIKGCTSYSNSYGIHVESVDSCIIYHNNLFNNTVNAYDTASSNIIWYNTTLPEGNYYDDYSGEDNNHDSIGDTPYNISGGNNQDLYPLMTPYGPPHADFTSTINDKVVTFNASFSYDYDGTITSYVWNFGDGTNGTGKVVDHTYADYGNYTVTLTVLDNDGNIDSISELISVIDMIPPEIQDNTPSIGYTGDVFTFNATITDNVDIDVAFVHFWYDSGDETILPLSNVAGDYWKGAIYIENTLDPLMYYIATSDTSGNFNSTESKTVPILDNDAPTFIDNSPSYGTTGDSFTFHITAYDNIEVAGAKVTWTHGKLGGTNVSLNACNDSTWSLTVTLDNNISGMLYTITVTDTSNNAFTGPQMTVPVTDNDDPTIIDQTPTVAHAGDPFTFNVTVTDNIVVSEVWVEYWFDDTAHVNTTMANAGGNQWEKTIAINLTSVTLRYIISAVDSSGNWQHTGTNVVPIGPDYPPETPQRPTGPASGKINTQYTYNTTTTDPNEDQVYFKWSWGDGNISDWLGPYASGEIASAQHTWDTKGTYEIKVKAKDVHGLESDWSDPLPITMPLGLLQQSGQSLSLEITQLRLIKNSILK